jgi:hypothetical protein
VPPGTERLGYSFRKSGRLQGTATLLLDGEAAGQGDIAPTLGIHINATGVSVGCDRYGPVSALYDSPYAFGSGLRRVVLEIGDDVGGRLSEWIAD